MKDLITLVWWKIICFKNKMFREDSNTAANDNNIIIIVICIHISTIFTGQIFTGEQFKSWLVWTIIICWNKSCSFSSTSFKVIKSILNQGLLYLTMSTIYLEFWIYHFLQRNYCCFLSVFFLNKQLYWHFWSILITKENF